MLWPIGGLRSVCWVATLLVVNLNCVCYLVGGHDGVLLLGSTAHLTANKSTRQRCVNLL